MLTDTANCSLGVGSQNREIITSVNNGWWFVIQFDCLQPHGLQHARIPCPSLTPGACSNSCPLSLWCHPTISSSVIPFSSHLQSSPDQGVFYWVSSSHQVAKLLEFELQDSTWISLYSYCSFQHLWILWFVLCRWASAGPYSYYDTLIARCLVHLTSVSVPDMSSICWVFLDAIADLCKVNFHRTMSKIFCHILIIMNNVELNNCMF